MGDYFSINNPNVDNSTGENYGVKFIKSDYYYNIEEHILKENLNISNLS